LKSAHLVVDAIFVASQKIHSIMIVVPLHVLKSPRVLKKLTTASGERNGRSKTQFFGTKFSPTIIDGQWKKRYRKFCRLHIEKVIPFECLSSSPLIISPDDRYSSRSPRGAEVAALQLQDETLAAPTAG
jgi:hypothetical protein